MELVNNVYELSERFMKNSRHVSINDNKVNNLANLIKNTPPSNYTHTSYTKDKLLSIIIELVASSINYCYWYGRGNIRPNGTSSGLLYELVVNHFSLLSRPYSQEKINSTINGLCSSLSMKRFPMLEERIFHLNQLKENSLQFCESLYVEYCMNPKITKDFEIFFNQLIRLFPGFSSDMFLKRASLFFLQLYRRIGILENEISNLHVPADYHIPQILNHYYCLEYSQELEETIRLNQLIPKHSEMECEIRSATVLVCKKLSEMTGLNISKIDDFLFSQKYAVCEKFHLTITTDY